MFDGCTNFNRDLSNWKVSNNWWITDAEHKYRVDLYNYVCRAGREVDYDNLDMFRGCVSLQYYHSWSNKYPNEYIYGLMKEEVLNRHYYECLLSN